MKEQGLLLLILAPMAGAWVSLGLGPFKGPLSRWTAFLSLAAGPWVLWEVFPRLLSQGSWRYSLGGWAPPWGIELCLTPFGAFFALFLFWMALSSLAFLGPYGSLAGWLKSKENLAGSLLVLLVSTLTALVMVRDGFTLYLLLQSALILGAGLFVSLGRRGFLDGFYFLLGGSAGASLLLAGILFLYRATGTLHLDDLLAQLFISRDFSLAAAAGVWMTLAWAFLFLFPAPYLFRKLLDRTPPFLLGFLSSALVRTGAFLLFLLYFHTLDVPGIEIPSWILVPAGLIVLFFLGHFFFAARQKDLLHSAAYLGLAQLGFLFLGFLAGNKSALTGALMELLSQMPAVLGLYLAVGVLGRKPAGSHPLSKLTGLGRQDLLTALSLVVLVFSIAGVPPTGGFFGKFFLAQGLVERKEWLWLGILALVVLFNFVTAGRFTWLLFEHRKSVSFQGPIPWASKMPLLLLALGALLLGLFHQEILHSFIEPVLPKAFLDLPVPNVPFLGKQVE